jgi:hypothetical protein
MEKTYHLNNRDGIDVSLKQIDNGNEYKLVAEETYFNVGPDSGDDYFFIDPPGGPMLSRFDKLPGYPNITITRIYHNKERQGFICVLKDDDKDDK